jgi:dihydroxyacetone kinase DhaKLM complex PTS-EIIA-like component DhaM
MTATVLTVVEQVTPDYTTTFTTNGVADLSSGVQDTQFGSEQYSITQTINSSMGWGDFVKIRDIGSARESEALKAAALRLATDIDAYIIGFAAKASNNQKGDGDTVRFDLGSHCCGLHPSP